MLFLPFQSANQREWPGSRLSGKTKEMVVIKTSHINGCDYCFALNTALGAAAGISHEQVINTLQPAPIHESLDLLVAVETF